MSALNLSEDDRSRLAQLLKDPKLDLPDFRRTVDRQNSNILWLRRNLMIRNSEVASDELLTLLGLKKGTTTVPTVST